MFLGYWGFFLQDSCIFLFGCLQFFILNRTLSTVTYDVNIFSQSIFWLLILFIVSFFFFLTMLMACGSSLESEPLSKKWQRWVLNPLHNQGTAMMSFSPQVFLFWCLFFSLFLYDFPLLYGHKCIFQYLLHIYICIFLFRAMWKFPG